MLMAKLTKARGAVRLSLFLLLLGGLGACTDHNLRAVVVRGETMGTFYNVTVVAQKTALPSEAELRAWADAEFARINQSMSTYIADSELSRINRGESQTWQMVSPELMDVLQVSAEVSHLSGGAFDITVMPLVDLWGFGPREHDFKLPSDAEIEQTLTRIGYKKLTLDEPGLRLQRPDGVTLDLSAVAKGYGADAFSKLLLGKGFASHMVEVGGELRLAGMSPRGDAWRIGVEAPVYGLASNQPAPAQTVALADRGMATSGDYRNYYELDGKRYSHTIDPTTGRPITHKLASVTVIADTAAEADAWATALNVLGPERGFAVAQAQGLAAYFIIGGEAGFSVVHTEAFAQYMRQD